MRLDIPADPLRSPVEVKIEVSIEPHVPFNTGNVSTEVSLSNIRGLMGGPESHRVRQPRQGNRNEYGALGRGLSNQALGHDRSKPLE